MYWRGLRPCVRHADVLRIVRRGGRLAEDFGGADAHEGHHVSGLDLVLSGAFLDGVWFRKQLEHHADQSSRLNAPLELVNEPRCGHLLAGIARQLQAFQQVRLRLRARRAVR